VQPLAEPAVRQRIWLQACEQAKERIQFGLSPVFTGSDIQSKHNYTFRQKAARVAKVITPAPQASIFTQIANCTTAK
jgi:hypothetical protein